MKYLCNNKFLKSYNTSIVSDEIKELVKSEEFKKNFSKKFERPLSNTILTYTESHRMFYEVLYRWIEINFIDVVKEKAKEQKKKFNLDLLNKSIDIKVKRIRRGEAYKGLSFLKNEAKERNEFYLDLTIEEIYKMLNVKTNEEKKHFDNLLRTLISKPPIMVCYGYNINGDEKKGSIEFDYATYGVNIIETQNKTIKNLKKEIAIKYKIRFCLTPLILKYFLDFDKIVKIEQDSTIAKYLKDNKSILSLNDFIRFYYFILQHHSNKGNKINFNIVEFCKAQGGRYYETEYINKQAIKYMNVKRVIEELKEFYELNKIMQENNFYIFDDFVLKNVKEDEENEDNYIITIERIKKDIVYKGNKGNSQEKRIK